MRFSLGWGIGLLLFARVASAVPFSNMEVFKATCEELIQPRDTTIFPEQRKKTERAVETRLLELIAIRAQLPGSDADAGLASLRQLAAQVASEKTGARTQNRIASFVGYRQISKFFNRHLTQPHSWRTNLLRFGNWGAAVGTFAANNYFWALVGMTIADGPVPASATPYVLAGWVATNAVIFAALAGTHRLIMGLPYFQDWVSRDGLESAHYTLSAADGKTVEVFLTAKKGRAVTLDFITWSPH